MVGTYQNTEEISAAAPKPAPSAAHSRLVTAIVATAPRPPARLGHPPSKMPAAAKATHTLPGAKRRNLGKRPPCGRALAPRKPPFRIAYRPAPTAKTTPTIRPPPSAAAHPPTH